MFGLSPQERVTPIQISPRDSRILVGRGDTIQTCHHEIIKWSQILLLKVRPHCTCNYFTKLENDANSPWTRSRTPNQVKVSKSTTIRSKSTTTTTTEVVWSPAAASDGFSASPLWTKITPSPSVHTNPNNPDVYVG